MQLDERWQNEQTAADGHLPWLLQQLRSAEFAHEGHERVVTRRRNLDFSEERVAKFEFEMLECAWAGMT